MDKIRISYINGLWHQGSCPDCGQFLEDPYDRQTMMENFHFVAVRTHDWNTGMIYLLCKDCDKAFRLSARGIKTQPQERSEFEIRVDVPPELIETTGQHIDESNIWAAIRGWRVKKKTFEKHQRQQQDEKLLLQVKNILFPDYLFEID